MNLETYRVISITVSGVSLLLCFLIAYLYFSKKNTITKENRIYDALLVSNIICLVFELLFYSSTVLETNHLIMSIFEKMYYALLFIWMYLHSLYIITIVRPKIFQKFYDISYKKKAIFLISSIVLVTMIIMAFPTEYMYEENVITGSKGISVVLVFCLSVFLLLFDFAIIIFDKKNIKKNKITPLFLFVILIGLEFLATLFGLNLLLITLPMTLVTLLMYHTIENPDILVIEQLNTAKDSAEKANRAKSDFLSSMSHEIRTPLNAIVGLSEDIVTYKEQLPKDVVEDAEDIINASNTLLEIVGNILDINKIESEKLEIIESVYHPKEDLQTLIKVLSTRIGEKPINLNVTFAPDLPYELCGDKTRVKQVVNNLLSNAIKYTDKGYINVNVKCINQEQICTLFISVEDSGQGIKAENISRLFTKFDRLDVERNTTTEGTGLGLAITKKLVELMNGKINVESQFGKGSIFMVQIPQKISKMIDNTNNLSSINVVRKEINYSGKRVLIVDDNSLNIKVARKALNDFHFIIEEASNGQECLDLINSGKRYDLILLDIMMPVMSGETALKELKKDSNFTTPVIALTADAISGAREKYIAIGFSDYIAKPFTKEQIKMKLDKMFEYELGQDNDRFKDVPVHVIVDNESMN